MVSGGSNVNNLDIMNSVHCTAVHSVQVVSCAVLTPTLMLVLVGHLFKRVGDFCPCMTVGWQQFV